MREIKFRAWDGLRMTTSGVMFNSTSGTLWAAANMPIMQYTGLHDKNGKEIYEGDIVKHVPEGILDTKMQIIWQDGSFYTAWPDGCTSHIFNQVFANCSTVIGNIYENPELVEKR